MDEDRARSRISQTLTNYTIAGDSRDAELFIAQFAPDAVLEFAGWPPLPRFRNAGTDTIRGMTDKWIYFVKNVGQLKSIPKTLANDKAINKALTIAKTASLTPQELEVQRKKLMWISDQKTNLARAELAERENAKAQQAAQEALDKAARAEAEKQAAEAEKQAAIAEKQAALDKAIKAEAEKQAALDKASKAEAEKQAATEKAEKAEKCKAESCRDWRNWRDC